MATTTGSTVQGLVDGMGKGFPISGTTPKLTMVIGNPSGIVTVQAGSDIAMEEVGGSIFMGLGSEQQWIALGSIGGF